MAVKLLNIEPSGYSSEAKAILEEIGELDELEVNRQNLLKILPAYDVLLVRLKHRIDSELLEAGRNLKLIISPTTGLNHIDLEYAETQGIRVLSLQGETEFLSTVTATAELTWGLLLELTRRIAAASRDVQQGAWERDAFKGMELRDKILGIVGFGRLGKIVAEYGKSFGMKVLAADPYLKDTPSFVRMVELKELLALSDVVTLHVNLNETTHGFFSRNEFRSMKQGAVFINTSRGELIDEDSLVEALSSGKLRSAACDVLHGETSGGEQWLANNPLWRYAQTNDNLLITPHIGGATNESMAKTEVFIAKKLKKLISDT